MTRRTCPGCARAKTPKQRYCGRRCEQEHLARLDQKRRTDHGTVYALDSEFRAQHRSTCPVCGRWIRGGSRIAPIVPMYARSGLYLDVDRRTWFDTRTGKPTELREYAYAHADCTVACDDKRNTLTRPQPNDPRGDITNG